MRRLIAVGIAVAFVWGGAAHAGPKSPKELAKEHFNKGYAYYQAGQYLKAVKELKKAYEIRPVPLVLYYIGKTYKEAGLSEEALIYFQRFLDEARLTDPHRKEVEGYIRELGGGKPAPGPTVATTPGPARPAARPVARPQPVARPRPRRRVKPGEIIHEPIEEARPNLPLLIEAELPENIEWARVYVYFRTPGMEDFVKRLMKPDRRGVYSYLIHHSYLRGKSLQYYVEAVGRDGKRIAGSGTASSPNIVLLSPDAPMQPGGRMDDSGLEEEAPAARLPSAALGGVGRARPGPRWQLYGAVGLTAATVGLVAAGVALGISSLRRAQTVADAGAARDATTGAYAYPPGTAFASTLQDYEKEGKTFEVASIVCYVLAAGAAGGATYLWLRYFGVVGGKERQKAQAQRVAPILGPKAVGLSYELDF